MLSHQGRFALFRISFVCFHWVFLCSQCFSVKLAGAHTLTWLSLRPYGTDWSRFALWGSVMKHETTK